MVEYKYDLNTIFGSLSDATRRDILERIGEKSMSIGEIAKFYKISFAAIAKHLNVLEKANLIHKKKKGKHQIITVKQDAILVASNYLEIYTKQWNDRLNSLDEYFNSIKK